jgi:CheY-like chemotaxis protein
MSPSAPRVLVAEDEALAAMALEDLLLDAGFRVILAADGQEALEIAGREPFDLLLTDLRMPRLDGRELIHRLRAARPDLPVVVMTGYAPPDGAIAGKEGGPLIVMSKPFDPERLVATIRRMAGLAA